MDQRFESIAAFAKRVGIPERVIRRLARQGKLPLIKTGRSHARIHVEAALEAIRHLAEQTAADIALTMPVEVPIIKAELRSNIERKYRGRVPDKVMGRRRAQALDKFK